MPPSPQQHTPSDRVAAPDRIAAIDAWLPQTQCTRCGYPSCRAYADAIARGAAPFNRCPPGGDSTLAGLARLLDRPPVPLDPTVGAPRPRVRAEIDAALCIGCWKCIEACPVDAILGARRFLHSVIASECTGCELCLPPCPVDCIRLVPVTVAPHAGRWPDHSEEETARARRRFEQRQARVARQRTRSAAALRGPGLRPDSARKKIEIRDAVARVKEKRRRAGSSLFHKDTP